MGKTMKSGAASKTTATRGTAAAKTVGAKNAPAGMKKGAAVTEVSGMVLPCKPGAYCVAIIDWSEHQIWWAEAIDPPRYGAFRVEFDREIPVASIQVIFADQKEILLGRVKGLGIQVHRGGPHGPPPPHVGTNGYVPDAGNFAKGLA